VFKSLGAGTNRFYIYNYGTGWRTERGNLSSTVIGVVSKEWDLITITWNTTYVNSYLNGVFIRKDYYGGNIGNTGLNTKISDTFNGSIDDVRVYNRSLTATEIKELYRQTTPKETEIINDFAYQYVDFNLTDIPNGNWKWNVWAGGMDSNSFFVQDWGIERNFSILDFLESSISFNSTTYETASETFRINITTKNLIPTLAKLIYNGTSYSATITNTVDNNYTLSKTIDIPLGNSSNDFYFNFTIGGLVQSSSTQTQSVGGLLFGSCNTSLTTKFLNISFKDEGNLTNIPASIPLFSGSYYLGSGTISKNITYTNNSEYYFSDFCATPPNRTLNIDYSIQYKGTNYPQRIFSSGVTTVLNSTTNVTLYLLKSADGIYVTFQVTNAANQVLSGVEIVITREISGADVEVGRGTTGADGSVTFWLNPDFTHEYTFIKSGFTTYVTSFAPTQAAYTISLGGVTAATSSYFKGVNYNIYPVNTTLVNDTTYTFGISLTSNFWDLQRYGFDLRLDNGTIITGGSTTTSGTLLTLDYDTNNQSKVYLDYYWLINDTYTNGTRMWITYSTDKTQWSIKTFFTDLTLYLDSGFFGIDDFGRYLIIFIIIFFTVGIFSYKFGFTSPLNISVMTFLIIFFFDVVVGIIPTLSVLNGREVPHLLTFVTGLILIMIVVREVNK